MNNDMTIKDLASYLRIGYNQARNLARSGKIKTYNLSVSTKRPRLRVIRESLDQFLRGGEL